MTAQPWWMPVVGAALMLVGISGEMLLQVETFKAISALGVGWIFCCVAMEIKSRRRPSGSSAGSCKSSNLEENGGG